VLPVNPSERTRTFATVSEGTDAFAAETASGNHAPVDVLELRERLLVIERRIDDCEARNQRLVEVIEAVSGVAELIGPLFKAVRPVLEPQRPPPEMPAWSLSAHVPPQDAGRALAPEPQDAPERLARAQARLRETLFADTETDPAQAGTHVGVASAAAPPVDSGWHPPPQTRNSWLRRAFKRMVREDPSAAGRLLLALRRAEGLAQLPPLAEVPWPPATAARLLVVGRVRRRIGWERAGLACEPKALSRLASLVRLRASPRQLCAAGVRLDAYLALSLIAVSIEPAWTAGYGFALEHRDAEDAPHGADDTGVEPTGGATYLTVSQGRRPSVATEPPPGPIAATIRCPGPALLTVLAGEPPAEVSIIGDRAPLESIQRWFARATSR
jgi:hypothetical protein